MRKIKKRPYTGPDPLHKVAGIASASQYAHYDKEKVEGYKKSVAEKIDFLISLGLKEEPIYSQLRMLLLDDIKAEKQFRGTQVIYCYPEVGITLSTPAEVEMYEEIRESLKTY